MKENGVRGKANYTDVSLIHVVLVWVFLLVEFMNRASKMGPGKGRQLKGEVDQKGYSENNQASLRATEKTEGVMIEMREPAVPLGLRRLGISDEELTGYYNDFSEHQLKLAMRCRELNDEVTQIRRIEQELGTGTGAPSESKFSTYWVKFRRLFNPINGQRLI